MAQPLLKSVSMDQGTSPNWPFSTDFWEEIVNDEALSDCDPLEKILYGCLLIAAADESDLLAA
jgi:hypothetical protein